MTAAASSRDRRRWARPACAHAFLISALLVAGPAAAQPADGGAPDDEAHAEAPRLGPDGSPVRHGTTARQDSAAALARVKQGRFEEALPLFSSALAKDPGNAGYITDYGYTLARLGRRAEAEQALRAAIDKDPHRWYAYANLADLLAEDPARWERRDAVVALLERGIAALEADARGRANVIIRLASFERAVGRTASARARLAPLLSEGLTRAQRMRVLELIETIELDERALALADWPAAPLTAAQQRRLDEATHKLDARDPPGALEATRSLLAERPDATGVRWLRARAHEALGRYDDAVAELTVIVQVAPSSARAWRKLGVLLASHGGALQAERADEALRHALALEPSWTDLRALRAELTARRTRAAADGTRAPRHAPEPSAKARALLQEAEEWLKVGDPAGLARDLLVSALAESPGFVAAALSAYAVIGKVPDETVHALWEDGPALWELASGVRRLSKDPAGRGMTRSWLDRAVALGVAEARFARAVQRVEEKDTEGAISDLLAYVAGGPRPPHLDEARALGSMLASAERKPSPELLSRIRLIEDRPAEALALLGGDCQPHMPAERLLALGLVHEHTGTLERALDCYTKALPPEQDGGAGEPATALHRLALVAARIPSPAQLTLPRERLRRAAANGDGAAAWVLARLASAAGDAETALADLERALANAGPDEPWTADASSMRTALVEGRARSLEAARRRREVRRAVLLGTAGGLAGAGTLVALLLLFHGMTLAGALRRRPALFPEVARAVAELRHDVLKHRASVLGLLSEPGTARADVRRALLEPEPLSTLALATWERLRAAARGQGLTLRRLRREPVMGPLVKDLRLAEELIAGEGHGERLQQIDARLRDEHAEGLKALLRGGPRTALDVGRIAGWIRGLEAEHSAAQAPWMPPALMMSELAVEFPVEDEALAAVFTNLLRNAEAAVGAESSRHVIVRVETERDATGRTIAALVIGDSCSGALTLESIESRESGRGLAIVRDLVRLWRGSIVIRPEAPPYVKSIGVRFPL